MAWIPKLEKVAERGVVLIEETIELVRLTKDLVRVATPVVAELPTLIAATRSALERGSH